MQTCAERLTALYQDWQQKQIRNRLEDPNGEAKTIPKSKLEPPIPPNNFFADGCLKSECPRAKYLYILKECNLSKDRSYDAGESVNDSALRWRRSDDTNAKKLRSKILDLFQIICPDASVSEIAVMNINKRGGYAQCNEKALEKYGEKYARFIRDEINIYDPEFVICANRTFDILRKQVYPACSLIAEDCFRCNGRFFFRWWHPSASKPHSAFKKLVEDVRQNGI